MSSQIASYNHLKLIVHRHPYLTFCNTTNWLNICTSFNLVSVLHQSILTILLSNLSEHQFLFIFGLGNALSSTLFSNQLKLIFFFLSQTPMNPGNLAPVVTRTSKNMAEAARVSGGLIDFLTRVLYWCCLFFFSFFITCWGRLHTLFNQWLYIVQRSLNHFVLLSCSFNLHPTPTTCTPPLDQLYNQLNLTEVFNSVSPCAS